MSREYVELSERLKRLEAEAEKIQVLEGEKEQLATELEATKKKKDGLEAKTRELADENGKLRDEIQSLKTSLKNYSALDEAIRGLVEQNLNLLEPKHATSTRLELTPEQVEVALKPANKRVVEVDASKSYQGKILQVMVKDLKDKEWVTTVDVSKALEEHGWPRSKDSVRLDFLNMIKDGTIIKDGTKYRLPKAVNFTVAEAKQ